jgi:signal transduction histidine kinase/PAS domain-containing protein
VSKEILIVDNDEIILAGVGDALGEAGFIVSKARNGLEALEQARRHPPDLIVTDLIMPVMDGRQLCRHLSQDPQLSHVPVVVLTATIAEGLPSAQELQEIGAKAYVAKRRMDAMVVDILDIVQRLGSAEVDAGPPVVVGLEGVRPRVIARELLSIKRHLDTLLAALGEAVIEFNETHQIVYVNPAGVRLLGRSETELVAVPIGSVFGDPIPAAIRRMEQSGGREEFEFRHGGRVLKVTMTGLTEENRPAGGVMILQDISHVHQRLQEMSVLNQVTAAFTSTLDFPLLLRLVMEQVVELMKVEAGSLLLKEETGELTFAVVLGERRELLQGLRVAAEEGIAGWVASTGEALVIPDVSKHPMFSARVDALIGSETRSVLCVPVKTAERVLGVIQLINRIDRTPFGEADLALLSAIANHAATALESAQLHDQLLQTNQQLLETHNQKNKFISQLSQEVRTPLTGILGYAELLQDKRVGPLSTRQQQYLQNIYGSAQHILKLANDLLELAQDDVGRRTFFAEEFSPLAVLEEVSALMAPQAVNKGITFSVQGEPRLPPMRGDHHQFRQILLNLVSNALKFTADRGEVTVAAHLRDPGTLAVSVRDNGIGIRPEDRQRIFDPFGRGQNAVASRIPGVGLGLTLTKRLVELQGGEISVESEGEDRGSTFTFTLPVTPLAPVFSPGGSSPGTSNPPRSGSQPAPS